MNIIFLYGPPASGKTTLGRRLAVALKTDFIDLDAVIVDRAGRSIPEIFAADGEAAFRDLESAALAAVVAGGGTPVVALGGGTLLREENRLLCEGNGTIFCLDAPSDEELARRIGLSEASRPLGDRARERAAHYTTFPRRIAAFFEAGESLVTVGSSIAAAVLRRYPVVADETVAALHSSLLSSRHFSAASARLHGSEALPRFTLPSGERHKTLDTVSSVWSFCAGAGLGRKDVLCALGGGVTGDLTGFAAATWMRGIDWINVPTTLLSMVDASTGGKTGFDLPEGKNLVGAFHPPRLVVIDTDFLATLPPEQIAAGRAEMIKHEVIGAAGCGSGRGGMPTPAEIAANLMVKVNIVREDPFERTGKRLLLNCGHTVAHAVEKLTDYRVSHGEAVAIGCVEEARLAVRLGLAPSEWPEELAARFTAAGLPTELPDGLDFEKMRLVMRGDKKRIGDMIVFALPCGWGDVRAVPVPSIQKLRCGN